MRYGRLRDNLFSSFDMAKKDIYELRQEISSLNETQQRLMEQLSNMQTAGHPHKLNRKNDQHVVSRDDGWAVKRAGASKATQIFERKTDAVKYAKDVAESRNACLVVHNKDGSFQKIDCS